jgi:hypothetical protein
MNSASKNAAIALLMISVAGCADKKANTAPPPPPQAQAPAIPSAGKAGAMYPPPLTESQTQTEPSQTPPPAVAQTEPAPAPPTPPPSTTKSTTKKSKPTAAKPTTTTPTAGGAADTTGTSTQAQTTTSTESTSEVATTGEPAAASPIGELTTGDTAGQAQKGKDTNELITNTENGLNAIKRTLSTQEQETANQIKAFLDKARKAYTNQDLDGAFTLATKAKVLLDELNKT